MTLDELVEQSGGNAGQIYQQKERAADIGGQGSQAGPHRGALSLCPGFIDSYLDRPAAQNSPALLYFSPQHHNHRLRL
jgi:hypothetical protein